MQDLLDQWGGDFQFPGGRTRADRGLRVGRSRACAQTTPWPAWWATNHRHCVAIIVTDFSRTAAAPACCSSAQHSLRPTFSANVERLARKDGATEAKVNIAGRDVSFLSTPDGSVRSYYVVDGDYHFVTTSKTLARRFLETQGGQGALGAAKEFRHTRSVMPLQRKDTVFVYLSDPFFRNYTSPAYRIETIRRFQAMADMELVQLAQLSSATEGKAGHTIEQLGPAIFCRAISGRARTAAGPCWRTARSAIRSAAGARRRCRFPMCGSRR